MIYLVHLHLASRGPCPALPAHTVRAVVGTANHSGLLHVVVHPRAQPHPIVGLYLREATLDRAEAAARQVWQHAAAAQQWLDDWELIRAEVPLMADGLVGN